MPRERVTTWYQFSRIWGYAINNSYDCLRVVQEKLPFDIRKKKWRNREIICVRPSANKTVAGKHKERQWQNEGTRWISSNFISDLTILYLYLYLYLILFYFLFFCFVLFNEFRGHVKGHLNILQAWWRC